MTDRQTQMTPQPKAAKSSYSRAEWMTLLAEAPVVELEAHWRSIPHPKFDWVRRPEYGSAMIRGRASGTGAQFNLGDVTVTRCTLQLETGEIGGLSQTFGLNRMLTIGMEFAAPKVAERAHDSECYCREAEAPIKG
ncbi:phosphonate C-P lyase system protein PhnG [Brucella sp. NBRC 113783]|nr:phosphonate C-P lyase system protein PhnG [Brucella sp. NBRC 113783]MDX4076621.1 phosphonate C-P lyase system protein PhnG [Brucella sp. NBRC 113783]